MNYSFKRIERLKSYSVITNLFKQGQSFGSFPLRLVYLPLEEADTTYSIQFALSVPKKKFPRAHDRNLLRRRIREAYRLHKHEFYQFLEKNKAFEGKKYAFMVLYTAHEILPYADIEAGMKKMLYKFKKELNVQNTEGGINHSKNVTIP